MNKQNIIGVVLMGVLLLTFSIYTNNQNRKYLAQRAQQQAIADSLAALNPSLDGAEAPVVTDSVAPKAATDSTFLFGKQQREPQHCTISNELLAVTLSSEGAQPVAAQLKGFLNHKKDSLYLFKEGDLSLSFPLRTNDHRYLPTTQLSFEVAAVSDQSVVFRLPFSAEEYMEVTYSLPPNSYQMQVSVDLSGIAAYIPPNLTVQDFEWSLRMPQQEAAWRFENQYATAYYKFPGDDVEKLKPSKKSQEKVINEPLLWAAFTDKYFTTVLIAEGDNRLENNQVSFVTEQEGSGYVKHFKHRGTYRLEREQNGKADFSIFMGPMQYQMFKEMDKKVAKNEQLELHKMVYLGSSIFRWLNIHLIMPIVNFLKSHISNWGIIILLLTFVIKLLLSPLTFKSFLSQAKMRVLKPQIEAINEKYPGSDQKMMMQRSQATMALYKSAGASPMSGCLPMLLQMPFLIALYMFFPTAIDLRGQSFLWAQDLSTYDGVLHWNAHLPLIGDHISLFCLLWCITNILYSRYTMNMSGTGDNPQMQSMKYMPYMMTVMFFFFFNSQASGLTYYYLISTLITVLQFVISRAMINEEKVLARMEENKKKPKKKSFVERLEEMQREQEKRMRQQQKKSARR